MPYLAKNFINTLLLASVITVVTSAGVNSMALFDFLKVYLFSEVNGFVLMDGKPVVGAEITRTAQSGQKIYSDKFYTDENGKFHFDSLSINSVSKIFPAETVITQKISINHNGNQYLAWKTVKRTPDKVDELQIKLNNLKCELRNSENQIETERGVIIGICEWN